MPKIAVVTGGGRGIGASTASLLAARGWDVCISYRVDDESAQQVVDGCRARGQRAIAVQADVALEADVLRLFATVDAELGLLSALVNNAGIVALKAKVEEFTTERIERMLAVNVLGPFLCAREAVRRMSTARGGSGGVIVNVSSGAARLGSAGEYIDYAASKGALDSMTIGLSKEVAAEGIRVNTVRPGLTYTDIHATTGNPDRVRELERFVPMGRAGYPEEIAAAIAWMCSEEASYVSGAILDVNGAR